MASLHELLTVQNGQQVRQFPMLADMARPEFGRQFPTLRSLLETRTEPFWQRSLLLAFTPHTDSTYPQEKQHPLVAKTALAIRALDLGMDNLTVDERFEYLYRYVASSPDLNGAVDYIFPLFQPTKLTLFRPISPEREQRFQRFWGYMQALEEIQSAGRPDILIVTTARRAAQGGIYTELDYWVEQQLLQSISRGQQISSVEIAKIIPQEFTTTAQLPVSERAEAILRITRRLHEKYGRLAVPTEAVKTKRYELLEQFLLETPAGYALSISTRELSERLGIGYDATVKFLAEFRHQRNVELTVPNPREKPTPETVLIAKYIIEAIAAIEAQGKNHRWRYGEIKHTEIADYITQHYRAELGIVNKHTVAKIIDNYLSQDSPQYEGMPTQRLQGTRNDDVHETIKQELLALLRQEGHSHDPEQLAVDLQLTEDDNSVSEATLRRIKGMLKELEAEEEITIDWSQDTHARYLIPADTRFTIIEMFQAGYPYSQIMQATGLALSSVRSVLFPSTGAKPIGRNGQPVELKKRGI